MRGGPSVTLLIVSPRDVEEALAAVRGGADILDIKNPSEGSLGANFPWVIAEVRRAVPSSVPVSASIGDFPDLPGSASLAAFGAVKAGAGIVKIGLRGPRDLKSATELASRVVRAVREADGSAKTVVCAYGDFERSGTINPILLPKIAEGAGADIVMLDTAVKDGKTLLDFLSVEELGNFVVEAHSRGLLAALSGSLGPRELESLKRVAPDVIGVRGAACEGGDREKGRISEFRVRELKKLLEG
jgi:hypothetical protein